jgi:DNA-binding beta-propeller fold protein YncE
MSTRRGFIGGAAAAGAAHTVAGPLLGASAAKRARARCVPVAPGIATVAIAATPAGRTIWTTDAEAATITAHRRRGLARTRSIDVGGAPRDIAISADGELALVTTAFFDRPGLAVVGLRAGHVERLEVGPEPAAVAFAATSGAAFVSGGGAEGTLTRVLPASGRVLRAFTVGRHPRGLAILPDGRHALVALNGEAAVALVSLAERRVVRRIATAPFPSELALSPDGKLALVTHSGFGERELTLIDVRGRRASRRIAVGLDPAGVAFSRSGALALATASGSGTAVVLDVRRGRRRRTLKLGGVPRAVTVAGSTGFVADARSGVLKAVPLGLLR